MNFVKKRFLCFLILSVTFFSFSIHCTQKQTALERKTSEYDEIQRCIFLEKKLLPQKPATTFVRKLFKIIIQTAVPLTISYAICRIVDDYVLKSKTSCRNDQDTQTYEQKTKAIFEQMKITNANSSNRARTDNSSSNFVNKFDNLKGHRGKLNILLFSISTALTYFLTRYLTREKEITDLQRLSDFLKDWPDNKAYTPEKFHKKFDLLHSLYAKEKKLALSEQEAKKIVRTTIMETIDYKISLQYSKNNLSSPTPTLFAKV